jgi:hypothetical protein
MGANWNGKLAVIGGRTKTLPPEMTGVIEVYDPASNTWERSSLAITPREAGVAVVDSARTYTIGGASQNSLSGDSLVEVVASDGVCRGPALDRARVQITGGLLPSGLVVAGGWTGASHTDSVEGLLGARSAWQPLPPMQMVRGGAASAVVNGSLIVAGGGEFQGGRWVYLNAVDALEAN